MITPQMCNWKSIIAVMFYLSTRGLQVNIHDKFLYMFQKASVQLLLPGMLVEAILKVKISVYVCDKFMSVKCFRIIWKNQWACGHVKFTWCTISGFPLTVLYRPCQRHEITGTALLQRSNLLKSWKNSNKCSISVRQKSLTEISVQPWKTIFNEYLKKPDEYWDGRFLTMLLFWAV